MFFLKANTYVLKHLPLAVFSFVFTITTAQNKSGYNWYFGHNAAITFNTTPPSALTNSAMDTEEGCSSISDGKGHLLFYTNGNTVYNKNHQIMLNGTGLYSGPYQSSVQSCIIIKKPNSCFLYYIFTSAEAETLDSTFNGYHYSIVDMSLDGGNGAIIEKNTLLYSPSSEQLTATRHQNGKDYWIITHEANSNKFRTFLLNENGISLVPVISSSGSTYLPMFSNIAGHLKVSSDGSKLVSCRVIGIVELFKFNNASGEVSDAYIVDNTLVQANGVSFSPDNSKLYVSDYLQISFSLDSILIYQYDLSAGTPAISATKTLVSSLKTNLLFSIFSTMQIGPDDKIYIARKQRGYLTVINQPNLAGVACNVQIDNIYLNGKLSATGLPNFMDADIINTQHSIDDFTYSSTCYNDSIMYLSNINSYDSIRWEIMGDDDNKTTSNKLSFNHKHSTSGNYNIQLIIFRPCYTDTVIKNIYIKDCENYFHIPNSFTPENDGLNTVFKPVLNKDFVSKYELKIYNRWGNLLFESTDINSGWNGTVNGKIAQEGVYIYAISTTDYQKKFSYHTGHLNLIK